MSEKASGNENPSSEFPDGEKEPKEVEPIGEEVPVDPQAGDLLDPVDRWWSDAREEDEEEEGPKNRKLDPEEMAQIAEKAKRREEEAAKKLATGGTPVDEVTDAKNDIGAEAVENVDDSGVGESTPEPGDRAQLVDQEQPLIEEKKVAGETQREKAEEAESETGSEPVLEGDSPPERVTPAAAPESAGASLVEDKESRMEEPLPEILPEASPAGLVSGEKGDAVDIEEKESSDSAIEPEAEAAETAPGKVIEDPDGEGGSDTTASDGVPVTESVEEATAAEQDTSTNNEPPDREPESDSTSKGSAIPASAGAVASGKEKKKGGCWSAFTTLFFFASLIVLLALVGLGLYGWSNLAGIEKKVTDVVDAQLAKRGLYLDYEDWRYQFPRGIIIEGIKVYETPQKEQVVLIASDVGINVDFLKLIQDRTSFASAEITFDDSELNFFHMGEQVGTVEEMDAEIFVNGGLLNMQRFQGRVGGLVVQAAGVVNMPGAGEGTDTAGAGDPENQEAKQLELDFSELKKLAPYLDILSEGDAPVLNVEFSVPLDRMENLKFAGQLSGENFQWMEIPMGSVLSSFEFDPIGKVVHFPAFQVKYGEGLVSGEFSFDTNSQVLAVKEAQSSIDLIQFLSDYSEDMASKLKAIEFVDSPLIRFEGEIPVKEPAKARIQLSYNHRQGLKVLSEDKELPIKNLGGDLSYADGGLQTDNFTASLFDGMLRMNGIVRLTKDPVPFRGLIKLSEMSLARIGEYFEGEDSGLSGDVFLEFNGAGYTELKEIKGGGSLRIDNAKLTSFPVVGQVQEFLGQIVPAFGIAENGSVRGAYTFESGVLITNDLTVVHSGAELKTTAMIRMESKYVDFTSTAKLQERLAKATGLEGKEVVVEGEGPLGDLSMSVSGFPIDFAATKLSEVLGTSPDTVSNLKKAIGNPEDAARILGEQLEGELSGEEVNELGEEIGSLLRGLLGTEEEEEVRERAIPVEGNE